MARTLILGALGAVDNTMEETFMKFSKSLGTEIFLFCDKVTGKAWFDFVCQPNISAGFRKILVIASQK